VTEHGLLRKNVPDATELRLEKASLSSTSHGRASAQLHILIVGGRLTGTSCRDVIGNIQFTILGIETMTEVFDLAQKWTPGSPMGLHVGLGLHVYSFQYETKGFLHTF